MIMTTIRTCISSYSLSAMVRLLPYILVICFFEVRKVRTGEFTLLPRELGLPASGRQWFETAECSYAVFTYIHAHCLKLQEDSKRRDFMPRWMTSVGAISER